MCQEPLDNPGSVGWEGGCVFSHLTCDDVSFLCEHSDKACLSLGGMVDQGLRHEFSREFMTKEESKSIRCSSYSLTLFYHVTKISAIPNEKGKLVSFSITLNIQEGGRSSRERSCEQIWIKEFGGSPIHPKNCVGGRV